MSLGGQCGVTLVPRTVFVPLCFCFVHEAWCQHDGQWRGHASAVSCWGSGEQPGDSGFSDRAFFFLRGRGAEDVHQFLLLLQQTAGSPAA